MGTIPSRTFYELRGGEYESGDEVEGPPFHVRFRAMQSHQPYRTPRTTRKPVVEGPQTATVVGQADQEIWTDTVTGKYGHSATEEYEAKQGANVFTLKGSKATLTNGTSTITLDGGKVSIVAADELSLVCGSASIRLTSSGGVDVAGAQKVGLGSGPSAVVVEPAGVNVSGPKIGASAIGMHEISGALVKIN